MRCAKCPSQHAEGHLQPQGGAWTALGVWARPAEPTASHGGSVQVQPHRPFPAGRGKAGESGGASDGRELRSSGKWIP